jgi:ABC-2 type transport system ATP-binding protein
VIEAVGLSKRYGATVAVDDLSFTVTPGQVTGFLGPNGAGKSTTMRMVLGLDRPSYGSVRVAGRGYAEHRRPLHQVGAVLDARAAHGGRSAYHHLLVLAQSNGIAARRVREVLDLVGLSDAADRLLKGFSLGMSQRLAMAAALLGDPGVILCDEPLNGLDPEGIHWMRTLLRSLAAEGRTVFVSSHLMAELAVMADHVVVIGRGRLLADSPLAEFVSSMAQQAVTVRTPQPDRLADRLRAAGATVATEDGALVVIGLDQAGIGDLACELGIALHELAPQTSSLESAFLRLTHDSVQFRSAQVGS